MIDSERTCLFMNSWLLRVGCCSVSSHLPTLGARLPDNKELKPQKCFLLLIHKADMEHVVLSRTPGVPDAVGKISVLFTYFSFHGKYMNILDPSAM